MADSIAGTRPLIDTYGLYIDGRWVEPDSGRYDVVNPATEEVIATAPDASAAQVERCDRRGPPRIRQRSVVDGDSRGPRALPAAAQQRAPRAARRDLRSGPGRVGLLGKLADVSRSRDLRSWPGVRRSWLRSPSRKSWTPGARRAPRSCDTSRSVSSSILTPWNFPHTLNVMKVAQRAGCGKHRRAQAIPADSAGGAGARADHRRAHRHPARRGQRGDADEHRGQQAPDHRSARRHGQLHRQLGRRPGSDGRRGQHA